MCAQDVDSLRGGLALTLNHSSLEPVLRGALEQHDGFLIDSTPGITEEGWRRWFRQNAVAHGAVWMKSRAVHNSHLLVIRRRAPPQP